MTLTELKYIVAVARERHFGRAAEQCFVSQPTLSVAIKKFEDELSITLFERGGSEISVTPIGAQIIEQAQKILDQANTLKELAKVGKDPLAGPLKLGIIYTIGPYLLPHLIKRMIQDAPQMPLILQENFTVKLLDLLRSGEIDVAVLAEPFSQTGLITQALYDEPFIVALPKKHEWSSRQSVSAQELKKQTMLLLGTGHCFRDQVLEVCPELSRFSQSSEGIQRSFEGSSLETIRHMVASGIGITVLPIMATPNLPEDELLRYLPFEGEPPVRRIVLAWRKSFTRTAAIDTVRNAVLALNLPAIHKLPNDQPQFHPH